MQSKPVPHAASLYETRSVSKSVIAPGSSTQTSSKPSGSSERPSEPTNSSNKVIADGSENPFDTDERLVHSESKVLNLEPSILKDLSRDDLLQLLDHLANENLRLKTTLPLPLQYTWRTLHSVDSHLYLEPPEWRMGENGPKLSANLRLHNVKGYIKQHPEIAFVYYNYYSSEANTLSQITSEDGVYSSPEPTSQALSLVSRDVISAVERIRRTLPRFSTLFPNFSTEEKISEPYMFIFYSLPMLDQVHPQLSSLESQLLNQLIDSVLQRYGKEYEDAQRLATKNIVTRRFMKYLVRPGDVLVRSREPQDSLGPAYMATTWLHEEPYLTVHNKLPSTLNEDAPSEGGEEETDEYHIIRQSDDKDQPLERPSLKEYSWKVWTWTWTFDGSFQKKEVPLSIHFKATGDDDEINIDSLNLLPLRFDRSGIRMTLERRGKSFWKCRRKMFVAYQEDNQGALTSVRA